MFSYKISEVEVPNAIDNGTFTVGADTPFVAAVIGGVAAGVVGAVVGKVIEKALE